MEARGKRSASPLVPSPHEHQGLKGRNIHRLLRPFRAGPRLGCRLPGATRFALAPGFHIPRRWRSDPFVFQPWRSDLLRNLAQELAGPANYFALAHQEILINLLFLLA